MNISCRSVALSLLLWLSAHVAQAEFNPEGWAWKANIAIPQSLAGFVAMPLDGPIYDSLLNPPHDLRLVNPNRSLVPHAYRCGRATAASKIVTRPVQLINRTYTPHRSSRVVFDFGENVVKNKIQVELSGRNYRRKVSIDGGNNGVKWERVAEDLFLFDIGAADKPHKVDTLTFSENSFRYLRLTVENMADDPERVEIHNARVFYEEHAGDPQLAQVEIVERTIDQDSKTQSTIVHLDLGFRHMPLQTITLDIEDALFQRAYAIEGRDTVAHKVYRRTEEAWRADEVETHWNLVSQGIFYRIQNEGKVMEVTGAAIPQASYRFLRVIVKDNDDAPLDIKDATVDRRICALVFEAQTKTPYTLYGGNAKAGPASYDLSRLAPGQDIFALPQAAYRTIERLQPAGSRIPWSERYWYVMTGGIILAVGLMLWIILPVLRKEMVSGSRS